MSSSSVLLRILLSLSLVFNGSGYAFASGHLAMMAGHASADTQAVAASGMPQAPCDEGGAVAAHEAAGDSAGAILSVSGNAHPPGHSSPECCESGSCRCACVHGTVAAMPILADAILVPMDDAAVRRLVSAHAAPALPHLIRPPIG
jgi:hypothetical protein